MVNNEVQFVRIIDCDWIVIEFKSSIIVMNIYNYYYVFVTLMKEVLI